MPCVTRCCWIASTVVGSGGGAAAESPSDSVWEWGAGMRGTPPSSGRASGRTSCWAAGRASGWTAGCADAASPTVRLWVRSAAWRSAIAVAITGGEVIAGAGVASCAVGGDSPAAASCSRAGAPDDVSCCTVGMGAGFGWISAVGSIDSAVSGEIAALPLSVPPASAVSLAVSSAVAMGGSSSLRSASRQQRRSATAPQIFCRTAL